MDDYRTKTSYISSAFNVSRNHQRRDGKRLQHTALHISILETGQRELDTVRRVAIGMHSNSQLRIVSSERGLAKVVKFEFAHC